MERINAARGPNDHHGRPNSGHRVEPARRHERRWGGIRAEVVELHGPGEYLNSLCSDEAQLLVVLDEIGGTLETRPWPRRPNGSGSRIDKRVVFLAPGSSVWELASQYRYIRRVVIEFEVTLLAQVNKSAFDVEPFVSLRPFRDSHVWTLADLIAKECAEPSADQAYGKSLGTAVFNALLRKRQRQETVPRGLTPDQLRRATEYLERGQGLRLDEVARLVGLSRSHFSRMFKASTGLTPHGWYSAVRVRRAQHLLLESETPLADVALDCGFSDQSHLSRVFRSATGTTPGAWRRAHSN